MNWCWSLIMSPCSHIASLCIMNPSRFRCATLISAVSSILMASSKSQNQGNRIKMKDRNQEEIPDQYGRRVEIKRINWITVEGDSKLGTSKIQEKDFQRENDRFSSGLNIIVWILYVCCGINLICLRSLVRTRSSLCWKPGYTVGKSGYSLFGVNLGVYL